MILRAVLAVAVAGAWAGAEHHHDNLKELQKSPAYGQFDRMTSLLGEWEAKTAEGPYRVWYKMISGGTVLLETEKFGDEPEMITVYHLDKTSLTMTHYCSSNNQPHMHAVPWKDGVKQDKLEFAMDSVANLNDPNDDHMSALVVRLKDKDHFIQKWTSLEKGKPVTYEFELTRKRPEAPKKS